MGITELTAHWLTPTGGLLIGAVALLAVLVASFALRARTFCQYLRLMTGIELQPSVVRRYYRNGGRGAVRDLLIDLLITEDLSDPSRIVTPDDEPDTSRFELADG